MVLGQQWAPGLKAGRGWGCEGLGAGAQMPASKLTEGKVYQTARAAHDYCLLRSLVFLADPIMEAGHMTASERRAWPGPGL